MVASTWAPWVGLGLTMLPGLDSFQVILRAGDGAQPCVDVVLASYSFLQLASRWALPLVAFFAGVPLHGRTPRDFFVESRGPAGLRVLSFVRVLSVHWLLSARG